MPRNEEEDYVEDELYKLLGAFLKCHQERALGTLVD